MKKWTIIIQINAENNLIYDSISVINEIGKVESNAHVNYVVLFDGMPDPKFPKAPEHPAIYLVKKDTVYGETEPDHIFSPDFDDLAKPKILAEALTWIKNHYPAENYGFIYKGHGGAEGTDVVLGKIFTTKLMKKPAGSEEEIEAELIRLGGDLQDFEGYSEFDKNDNIILAIYTNSNEGEYLSYKKLAGALVNVFGEKGLGFVGLDCCWGQQIEHAYSFRNATNYFVASVDEMTSLGLGYRDLCQYLNRRPTILPYELASMFVAVNYVKNYADYDSEIPEFREMGVSLTAVDTVRLKSLVGFFNAICDRIVEKMDQHAGNITKALDCCMDYTYQMDPFMYKVFNVDLVWFLENFMFFNRRDHKLNDMIMRFIHFHLLYYIRGYMGNNYKIVDPGAGKKELGGRGVSIAFPRTAEQFDESIYAKEDLPEFAKDSHWRKMLKAYYKTLGPVPVARRLRPLTRSIGADAIAEVIREKMHIGEQDCKWRNFKPAKKKLEPQLSL